MDDDDIAELAKGMAPFVRECVADEFLRAALLPAELAEQVASAVRLLHEMPSLEQRAEAPRAPKITRVERDADGNFVPIYDERPT